MFDKKSIAPRVGKTRFMKIPEGKATSWLGWRQANEAINNFLFSSNSALETFSIINVSEDIASWLKEAIGGVSEYSQGLYKCSDDIDAAVQYVSDLREECEYLEDLLSFLRDVDALIDDQLGDDVSQEVRLKACDALEDVHSNGWHMYHVFIGAV